jgi:hypothetical protein
VSRLEAVWELPGCRLEAIHKLSGGCKQLPGSCQEAAASACDPGRRAAHRLARKRQRQEKPWSQLSRVAALSGRRLRGGPRCRRAHWGSRWDHGRPADRHSKEKHRMHACYGAADCTAPRLEERRAADARQSCRLQEKKAARRCEKTRPSSDQAIRTRDSAVPKIPACVPVHLSSRVLQEWQPQPPRLHVRLSHQAPTRAAPIPYVHPSFPSNSPRPEARQQQSPAGAAPASRGASSLHDLPWATTSPSSA